VRQSLGYDTYALFVLRTRTTYVVHKTTCHVKSSL
jgi:hypothetical protein